MAWKRRKCATRQSATRHGGGKVCFEKVEKRVLLSGPSAREQQMLELVNRLRINPAAELPLLLGSKDSDVQNALRFFGVDKNALAKQWKELQPVAPLAWNEALASAAKGHSQRMLDYNKQAHQLPGEAPLLGRVLAKGYGDASFVGENVFAFMTSVTQAHAGFAIDWGNGPGGIQEPAGHRENLMAGVYSEVGISMIDSRPGRSVGPFLVTQNFGARRGQKPYLLGVVYDDRNKDGAYSIGEGIERATVLASGKAGTFVTTSQSAGGYQMQLPAGTYAITVAGAKGIASLGSVTIGNENVKRDFVKSAFVADTTGPTAKLGTVGAVEGGAGGVTFSVTYSDPGIVDAKTIDSSDVIVSIAGGANVKARLVSVDSGSPGLSRVATYRLDAPGGFFDSADNGTYTLTLAGQQVADVNGNFAGSVKLGTISVNVPPAVITPFGVLVVNGGAGNDKVEVTASGTTLTAKVNGLSRTFAVGAVKRIYVAGFGGDDTITMGRNVLAATIDGGGGNDTITGTDRNDSICGGGGNDVISGGLGNDVLLGGAGRDSINGGEGKDRSDSDASDWLSGVEGVV